MGMRFRLRKWFYDLNTNLLFLPALELLALLGAGVLLPIVERAGAETSLGTLSRWLAPEPASAQLLLATAAGAVMSVVSVVYSILLVALSMLSMQFSTRVLAGFMRDRLSRVVLGLFVGTFAYCLAVVWATTSNPPFVPGIAVTGGLGLALVSLGALVRFIDHIVRSIQANVLVDRIATEAEAVLDAVFPPDRVPSVDPGPVGLDHVIRSDRSGYIQLVDVDSLLAVGVRVRLLRPNGGFVANGAALLATSAPVDATQLLACVDIGPERTMQDDAEFGFRQVVDIALKALSPAVNDPSTAATVVDHLGRLLLRVVNRPLGGAAYRQGTAEVWVPQPTFADLLDLAMEQIRQYAASDMAVSLRCLRILGEVAEAAADPASRSRTLFHADRILQAVAGRFEDADLDELRRRHAQVASAAR